MMFRCISSNQKEEQKNKSHTNYLDGSKYAESVAAGTPIRLASLK